MEMTLRQEAAEKLALLPDTSIRAVLKIVDELLQQHTKNMPHGKEISPKKKKAALKALIEMREQHPFPDIEFDEARRMAMEEKYGRIA